MENFSPILDNFHGLGVGVGNPKCVVFKSIQTSPATCQVAVSLVYRPFIVNLIESPSRPPGIVESARRKGILILHTPISDTVVSHPDEPIQAVTTVPFAVEEPFKTACPDITKDLWEEVCVAPGLIAAAVAVGTGVAVASGIGVARAAMVACAASSIVA